MAKEFNTSVTCDPKKHYMVDVTNKMKVFERLINNGNYFTITRARQFGKTSSLKWILHNMSDRYLVVIIDFNNLKIEDCKSDSTFCNAIGRLIDNKLNDKPLANVNSFHSLFDATNILCKHSPKPIVLIIDNADRFIIPQLADLLSCFRTDYIKRNSFGITSIFHSVILVSIKRITNLPSIIEERRFNSPWNVAAEYDLDMTFNPQEISTMLADYENDYHFGFDIKEISEEIYKYTSGYPVLVSRVCKEIDENLGKNWTKDGVLKAVKKIIKEKRVLSDDITKNLEIYPKLKAFLRALLLENFSMSFDANNPTLDLANMFSIIKEGKGGKVEIHNLVFQQMLYNYFISENTLNKITVDKGSGIYIDKNGDLDMRIVIDRFVQTVKRFRNDEKFLEEQGRLLFLCFLKPIINGTGFYYVEPENDDSSRMDIIVNYHGKEYVIELKLWYGIEYEISGRDQIARYITARNLSEGYLITFSFLKNKVVQEQPEWIEHEGKRIYEAVI
ncbi:MAG: AAA-like domain-containing protein [Bacteroidales bacterium]|nr:AAA-like domain-containing protein [Bacteroidales bacterium]